MITVKCEACGKFLEIPEQYRGQTGKCNACGAALVVPKSNVKPVPAWKLGCLYAFLGCVAVAFIGSWLFPDPPATNTTTQQPRSEPIATIKQSRPSFTPTPPKPEGITLAKFNQLREGMTYDQVVQVLGAEGTIMSENAFGQGQFRIHTVMYMWDGPGFMANMNCMFQNDRLMSRSQLGLR